MPDRFPASLAIAGGWGYIGRKFIGAARRLGLRLSVYDPGPLPQDLDLEGVAIADCETEFYAQQADLFHLALHPEQRRRGWDQLLTRSLHEPICVLCEKPMADPERPEHGPDICRQVAESGAVVLYDFPELFDPITQRIREYLAGFRAATIVSIDVQRSKDREDPRNARNFKRMVSIQYQESVHCLAFVLDLLGTVRGDLESVFADGLSLTARSWPYRPPNPDAYVYVVDGRCDFRLELGSSVVTGSTNFQRGAAWAKRRVVRGVGDGQPFTIEADFLEGRKRLRINDQSHDNVVATDSYAAVVATYGRWCREIPRKRSWRACIRTRPLHS